MSKTEKILVVEQQLKENGYRLTSQRKLLLEVIFEKEYTNCKEIYYEAKKRDASVGIATVCRMVQILEELNVMNKKMIVYV